MKMKLLITGIVANLFGILLCYAMLNLPEGRQAALKYGYLLVSMITLSSMFVYTKDDSTSEQIAQKNENDTSFKPINNDTEQINRNIIRNLLLSVAFIFCFTMFLKA
ncbi:hypothetical protein [Desulfovibrio psychrotolerans]|uniref:Uncharacterized protein n=1 Tax=Desulfovibrio psychrotolerans TaxID=415242 RepID=A0A7J0BVZ0_9BACT|nr:hypothetical protein [Desulfovibrio psychrotolerans]GFM37879.1 hypothetical protein DSM19430T_25630 [Desulfovibrio psychrotolerans]